MALDLELVREVRADEAPPKAGLPSIKRLRDSHHTLARLLARGLGEAECSHITGYALSRISSLKRDAMFADLIQAYRADARDVQRDIEAMYLGIANDYAQHIHERLDHEEVPIGTALDVFKAFADRGGFAPVSRSVNKNLNLNIGARLDAARTARGEP